MDLSHTPIRLARPSRDLRVARRFWVEGLGLSVLWQSGAEAEDGHALLMVGPPGGGWHLELVEDVDAHEVSRPGPEDLLVLYLGPEFTASLVDRLVEHGGRRVTASNPYWERWGRASSTRTGTGWC